MFQLDARLAADTVVVTDLRLCRVLLMKDARYPWLILVPRRNEVTEAFELEEVDQRLLWQEASLTAQAMKTLFDADKMNIATLGNVVSQLHIHAIARKHGDDAWPGPVWGRHPAIPYDAERQASLLTELKRMFAALSINAKG